MKVDNFYSVQADLRAEQRELINLLRDLSKPLDKNQLKNINGENKNNTNSEVVEAVLGLEIERSAGSSKRIGFKINQTDERRRRHSSSTASEASEFSRASSHATSPFHRGCTPKEPDRKFVANPIPTGILALQGYKTTRPRSRSGSPPKRATRGALKGILKNRQNQGNNSVQSGHSGNDYCSPPPSSSQVQVQQQCHCCGPSHQIPGPDHNSFYYGGHCNTNNSSWRPDAVSLSNNNNNTKNSTSEVRQAIELRSKSRAHLHNKREAARTRSASRTRTSPASKSNPRTFLKKHQGKMAFQKHSPATVQPPNPTKKSSSKEVCKLCHCYECYTQYIKSLENAASSSHSRHKSSLSDGRSTSVNSGNVIIPWTDEWFSTMVDFRKQKFWDCHAETTRVSYKTRA